MNTFIISFVLIYSIALIEINGYNRQIISIHNNYRRLLKNGKIKHQPIPKNNYNVKLKWDKELERKAKINSNLNFFHHDGPHDNRFSVGQNIFEMGASFKFSKKKFIKIALRNWFSEHKNFKYPNISKGVTGHYTQMIWNSTKYIGCGLSYYKHNYMHKRYIVCNYAPAGNNGNPPYKLN